MSALVVEPVTMEHAALIHSWRNHPATRAVSRDSGEIALGDHLQWLANALDDPSRVLLAGYSAGRPVGFVRFDFDAPERCEISIFLDPALHGRGFGSRLLEAAESYLMHDRGKVLIVAETLDSNISSKRLFERAGYQWLDGHFEKELG